MVRVVVPLATTVAGLKMQVAPEGWPEQENETVPLKPFSGVIVIVAVAVLPADTLAGVAALAPSEKLVTVAAQAWAKANASTEPRPVTWS